MKKPQQKPRYVRAEKNEEHLYASFQYIVTLKRVAEALAPTSFSLPYVFLVIVFCFWCRRQRSASDRRHNNRVVRISLCGSKRSEEEADTRSLNGAECKLSEELEFFHSLELPAPVVVGEIFHSPNWFSLSVSRLRVQIKFGGWRHVALEWLTYIRYRLLNEV